MGAAHSRSLRGRLRHLATNDTRIITLEAAVIFVIVWTAVSHQFELTGEISSPVLVAEETAELLVGMEWVSHGRLPELAGAIVQVQAGRGRVME